MFKFFDISIKGKLVIMQVFTSLLVLSIFFGVYILTDIKDYKQRKVNNVIGLAQVIGTNSVSAIQFQDDKTANEILGELKKVSPEIVYAAILDKEGNVFANYKSRAMDSSFKGFGTMKGGKVDFTGKHLFVKNEILVDRELIGYVCLEVELTELESIKQSKYNIATVLLLVSVGFSVLIAIAIQPYISKRLLLLVNRMKEVGKTGDYSNPVIDNGSDEISTLSKAFNSLMQQIRENEKKKDEFIGIASHELKTPLTSIKGYLELLDQLEDKHPNKLFVQKSRENVDKLERLIKDLLDVSKIQSGQLQLNMKEFNVDELIDETVASFQMVVSTHQLIKENRVTETVLADRQRIEQVLVNLLSNAIKYSPGESKILVSCKKNGTELIIKVRDYGIGIPVDEQENIFKRFYRTKDMSVHISGFGLGLYICRDIINRHKGKIWVEKEDKGSSFYFSLPLRSTAVEV